MKKLVTLCICLLLCVSLCACSSEKDKDMVKVGIIQLMDHTSLNTIK